MFLYKKRKEEKKIRKESLHMLLPSMLFMHITFSPYPCDVSNQNKVLYIENSYLLFYLSGKLTQSLNFHSFSGLIYQGTMVDVLEQLHPKHKQEELISIPNQRDFMYAHINNYFYIIFLNATIQQNSTQDLNVSSLSLITQS